MSINPQDLLKLQTAESAVETIIDHVDSSLQTHKDNEVAYGQSYTIRVPLPGELGFTIGNHKIIENEVCSHYKELGWNPVRIEWDEEFDEEVAHLVLVYTNTASLKGK